MPKIDLGRVVGDVNPETMIPFDDHSDEVLPPEADPDYDWTTATPDTEVAAQDEGGTGSGGTGTGDGTDTTEYVPDARTSIAAIVSNSKIKNIFSNIKAALMGLVTLGEMRQQLVNNGLCNVPGKYFLDAAYGKTLADQISQLNDDMSWKYVRTVIGQESIVFPTDWRMAIFAICPYPQAQGRGALTGFFMREWLSKIGIDNLLTTYAALPADKDANYVAAVAYRNNYVKLSRVMWAGSDILNSASLTVYTHK